MNRKELVAFKKLSEKEQRAWLIAHRPNLRPPTRAENDAERKRRGED